MRPSKRDEIVHKALQIFYENGFHATAMDTLVAKTGISKTSMYNHFKSKEDLIIAALRLRDEQFHEWFNKRIKELGTTPRSQLLAIFDALKEWFAQNEFSGCMFIKASSEYLDFNSPIHEISSDHKRSILNDINLLAEKAGAKDAKKLSCGLFLLMEGAISMAHLMHGTHSATEAKASARVLIAEALDDK